MRPFSLPLRRLSWRPRLALAVVAALAVSVAGPASDSRAVVGDPTVVLDTMAPRLSGIVGIGAQVTPGAGRTITSVVFEYAPSAPAANQVWTSAGTESSPSPGRYTTAFVTSPLPDGYFDVRAVATDDTGATASASILDLVIQNNSSTGLFDQANLADPGRAIRGAVTVRLTLTPAEDNGTPAAFRNVVVERSSEGTRQWATLGAPTLLSRDTSQAVFGVGLDTTSVPDGLYDLRGRGTGVNVARSPVVRSVRVDNTAPTVSLALPPGVLSGRVALEAAASDAGSGIRSVRFERAPTGTDLWTLMGSDRAAPFGRNVDTRQITNGVYDFRAVAEDIAGNVTTTDRVAGIRVDNPSSAPRFPSVRNSIPPAKDITILGVAGGETWAVGTSAAAPAEVNGTRLPYPAQGRQPVILRRTPNGVWQIVDVPRNANGTAFAFRPPATFDGFTELRGAMAPSGEAWLWIAQTAGTGDRPYGLFHRRPGGAFLLDEGATATLGSRLLGASDVNSSLKLTTTRSGSLAGVLVAPSQPDRSIDAPAPGGGTRTIKTKLDVGVLSGGAWSLRTAVPPADFAIPSGDLNLTAADVDPDGAIWALTTFGTNARRKPLFVGQLLGDLWTPSSFQLDVLDLPAGFGGPNAEAGSERQRFTASAGALWVGAVPNLGGGAQGMVVARYDTIAKRVTRSWCAEAILPESGDCGDVLDNAVAVPSASFATPAGEVALALGDNAVLRYADDDWERLPTPGHSSGAFFVSPEEGWFAGKFAVGHWAVDQPGRPLVEWPQANRSPLTSVATPTADIGLNTAGALAVGLRGTSMSYTPGAGWLPQAVPGRAARLNLFGVAFSAPARAMAVGQAGTILRWDGTAWTEDPQSRVISQRDLAAVAFRSSGEGWAVGRLGTILHFDGNQWNEEQPPAEESGRSLTSVATAGNEVFAVAGGNLITRNDDGTWRPVDPALLPNPRPRAGDLRVLAGLPDGGLVAGGIDVLLVRDGPGQAFRHSAQPIAGIAVALAATRRDGAVSPVVSVAQPAVSITGESGSRDISSVPAGDGELLRESGGGWQDMREGQYPGEVVPDDGVVKADPVLAILADQGGDRIWAVGGYAGTPSSSSQGSNTFLGARSPGWDTSSIWRFDADGAVTPPGLRQDTAAITDNPAAVTFAYFAAPECANRCSETLDAQPDVNLRFAADQIRTYAQQPGGPTFAILGGNARGPNPALGSLAAFSEGRGATEFRRLPSLLAPLGDVPLFAAFGSRDTVPTLSSPAEPWADAFASAPAPFGRAPAPPGISPAGSGSPAGNVFRHYAFDASRGPGSVRVVVIDNSAGSLEESAPGQTQWMRDRVGEARAAGRPVVVIAYRSLAEGVLESASDGASVAEFLAGAGVSGVFVAGESGGNLQTNVPVNAAPGAPQVIQFQGARLSYQPANSFVGWYKVSVDTTNGQVSVVAIPLVESLALKPLAGLSVARSQVLEFSGVARRPRGTLAATVFKTGTSFENLLGFDNYVSIPAPNCSTGVTCIQPDYTFTSDDPTIGDFVQPSGPGSRIPRLSASGRTTPLASSGLFCAYNSGTVNVSVRVGLLTASLPVTVRPGGFGRPCGTVARRVVAQARPRIPRLPGAPAGAAAAAPAIALAIPRRPNPPPPPTPPPAPPAPRRATPPAPVVPDERPPFIPAPQRTAKTASPIVPPILPAIPTPTPPGGTSPAQAPRREKAKKHSTQSASFSTRPAGLTSEQWLTAGATGGGTLVLLLGLMALRGMPRSRRRPVPAYIDRRR